jgi:hypothetical protein
MCQTSRHLKEHAFRALLVLESIAASEVTRPQTWAEHMDVFIKLHDKPFFERNGDVKASE